MCGVVLPLLESELDSCLRTPWETGSLPARGGGVERLELWEQSLFLMPQESIIHNNKNMLKCELCEKQFVHNAHIKRHMTQHTGFIALSCKRCKASFASNESLKRHMSFHPKPKALKCNFCKLSFTQRSSVTKHERRTHLKEKPYSCEFCSWGFFDRCALLKHKYRKHQDGKILS